ncbi:MAG TPA: M20 family metallo-hydrolase [Vicinamibacterales bacterium]|nr:M20 family metallo-hydrolase [Vicinamibacterales bacterium]
MDRRTFLGTLAAGVVAARQELSATTPPAASIAATPPAASIDAAALRERIEALSVFGRPADGSFADGVSRVAYSDADVAGRNYVMDLMRKAGLTPRIDAAANIFAKREGTEPALAPILFGSHIDSVPQGGNFDGDLGSLAALAALEACERAQLQTRHPLEIVVWAAEEGVAFNRGLSSSRIVAGDIAPSDMEQVWNGMRRGDAIKRIGGDPRRIMDARRPKGTWHGYLELHIEQGGTLERGGLDIGVVQGIVAIERYEARITGFANHAGTTPMADRQDAAVAAAHLTLAVREAVTSRPGRQVGTVGKMDLSPNAPNVVPGSATLIIELRDLSVDLLKTLAEEIRARAASIAAATKTTIEIVPASSNAPAIADTAVQDVIERTAKNLNLSSVRMPSGAGHDAQMMAQLAPMGMIFVPSAGGISHSPKELTSWKDCANGANVLLHAVLSLDRA